MPTAPAISVQNLGYSYLERRALDNISFTVEEGETFGLLGPNGGGKSTLFRILSTLLPLQSGTVTVGPFDLAHRQPDVRLILGVTFQSPGLDRKLTVRENLWHHGRLYGLTGAELKSRIAANLQALGVADRAHELVSKLSGGLQRRVEIAKSLLHRPRILLLDEPSTGLDPGAVLELWGHLRNLKRQMSLTILVSTHILNEAENCDRLAILHQGRVVAIDTPDALRRSVGGDCVTIQAADPSTLTELARQISNRFHVSVQQIGDALRIERENAHELLRDVMEEFRTSISSITLGKPTLSDVFVHRTGQMLN